MPDAAAAVATAPVDGLAETVGRFVFVSRGTVDEEAVEVALILIAACVG